jgi:hypothetical protein
MRAKIGSVIAGAALAMFVTGRAGNLIPGHSFADSQAWAQDSGDQTDDVASQDDAAPQDDAATPEDDAASGDGTLNSAVTNKTVSGNYSGTMMDDQRGAGTYLGGFIPGLHSHTKLSGTFTDTWEGPGFVEGTVSSSGAVTLKYRLKIKGDCVFSFKGTYNAGVIMGTYNRAGCKGGPGQGTLNIVQE